MTAVCKVTLSGRFPVVILRDWRVMCNWVINNASSLLMLANCGCDLSQCVFVFDNAAMDFAQFDF